MRKGSQSALTGSVIWSWTVPQAPGDKPTGVQRIDEARQRYRFCLVMMVSHG